MVSTSFVTWYRLYGNDTVTMQLDRLSLMERDTQSVNGLDSLEAALVKTVQRTRD